MSVLLTLLFVLDGFIVVVAIIMQRGLPPQLQRRRQWHNCGINDSMMMMTALMHRLRWQYHAVRNASIVYNAPMADS